MEYKCNITNILTKKGCRFRDSLTFITQTIMFLPFPKPALSGDEVPFTLLPFTLSALAPSKN